MHHAVSAHSDTVNSARSFPLVHQGKLTHSRTSDICSAHTTHGRGSCRFRIYFFPHNKSVHCGSRHNKTNSRSNKTAYAVLFDIIFRHNGFWEKIMDKTRKHKGENEKTVRLQRENRMNKKRKQYSEKENTVFSHRTGDIPLQRLCVILFSSNPSWH